MKRISFVAALCIGMILVGTGCARSKDQRPSPSVQTPQQKQEEVIPMGVLALDGGTATLVRGDVSVDAQDGTELLPGDTLKVMSGTIVIVYPDAGASHLESGTEVTLLPDGDGTGSVFAQIELSVGSIWTRFERLLGTDETFSVSGNGVVATVRGTAFGMEIVDGEADVQVADHEVEISVLEGRKDSALAKKTLKLASGEGFRIAADAMKRLDPSGMKRMVRKLSAREKTKRGFDFMSKKMSQELLKRRAKVRMPGIPVIPVKFRDRIDPGLLERLLQFSTMNLTPGFVMPTRSLEPVSEPTSTP
jgi:hypothetical protein